MNWTLIRNGIKEREVCLFWVVVLLFGAFWTFVPVWVIPNYRPDLLEMLVTGQNWVLATYKHGAFTTWLVEIFYNIFRRASWSPYFTSQLCVILSLWGLWQIGKEYLSSKRALLATFCMLGFYFFHFESTLYNNNTTLCLLWIWTVLFLLYALRTNRALWWILTGIALGIGFYCKLTFAILVISILVYVSCDRTTWRYLRTRGPWLTFLVSFVVFCPLLLWMYRHEFVNLTYAQNAAGGFPFTHRIIGHLVSPLNHLASQILYIVPILFPLFFIKRGDWKQFKAKYWRSGPNRLLTLLIFVPVIVQIVVCMVTGSKVRAALGLHCWLFLPVWYLNSACSESSGDRLAFRMVALVQIVVAISFIVGIPLSPAITGRGSRYHFPGREMALQLEREWSSRFSAPLSYVRGDVWLAENASVYARVRPVFWDSQWSTESEFVLKGGLYLWNEVKEDREAVIKELKAKWPQIEILSPLILEQQTCFTVPPARIGAAIIAPKMEYHQNND